MDLSWLWWGRQARSAEALRRLGGKDADAERRKRAMDGEQKAWVAVAFCVCSLAAWGLWLLTSYQIETAAINAQVRPAPEAIWACVHECADSCTGVR